MQRVATCIHFCRQNWASPLDLARADGTATDIPLPTPHGGRDTDRDQGLMTGKPGHQATVWLIMQVSWLVGGIHRIGALVDEVV